MTTTTWADGYGRWHVTLPQSPWAEQDALNALAAEILDRAPPGITAREVLGYLASSMIRRETSDPALIEYIEYGMEADLH